MPVVLLALAAALVLQGCPPPPPPPATHLLTQPRWIPNTLVTEYWPSPERWFHGPLVRAAGIPGRHSSDWLFGARGLPMEGEGIARDGRVYHFAGPYDIGWVNSAGGRTGPCRAPGVWTNGRPFRIAEPARARFAPGHSRPLVYWRSVAVDTHVIPLGSRIFMRQLCRLPSKGWVYARDTGSAIGGAHIDLYRPPPAALPGGDVIPNGPMLVVPPGSTPRHEPHC